MIYIDPKVNFTNPLGDLYQTLSFTMSQFLICIII